MMNEDSIDAATEAKMIRVMNFRDGRLSPEEAAAVAAEIASDPVAADFAEAFAVGDAAARAAWAHLESGPVPLTIARRVTEAARTQPIKAPAPKFSGWRAAAAVVIALGLGAAATALVQRDHGLHLAGLDTAGADAAWKPALVSALGQDPTLAEVAFKDGKASLAITRWFDTGTAMRCAEYKISGEAATAGGIACRRNDGGWDVIEQDQ
jgi:anti-sigma factor RsiW